MREPYDALLGQFHDHWFLGRFLDGDIPDFAALAAADPLGRLSSGELILCQIALALWNGDRAARIADLVGLDTDNRRRVLAALEHTCRV